MSLKTLKNDYFAFSGDKATWGEAHEVTGKRSIFGDTYRFKTKFAAEKFLENLPHRPVQSVGRLRTIRRYHYGISVAAFHEIMNFLDYEG